MSKSPLHGLIAALLYDRLAAQVPKGLSVWKEEPLTLADSEPEPDISITRGERRNRAQGHPSTAELVVEVAVSSPALDRENAALYAEAGIKEYWIVLGSERRVEVYRRPESGRYQETQTLGSEDWLECAAVPGVRLQVLSLFE